MKLDLGMHIGLHLVFFGKTGVTMGHTHVECGTGEFSEEELEFGGWMVADGEQ
jgi:hypothetical protein